MTDSGTDPQAEARVAVALAALAEVTGPADVGELVDATQVEQGLVDLHFSTTMQGYPGWRWVVSTGLVTGSAPTVLELALVPGEGALLAPPWIPWTERLAEWRRSHPTEDGLDLGDDEDADTDDTDEVDDDDVDIDGVEVELDVDDDDDLESYVIGDDLDEDDPDGDGEDDPDDDDPDDDRSDPRISR